MAIRCSLWLLYKYTAFLVCFFFWAFLFGFTAINEIRNFFTNYGRHLEYRTLIMNQQKIFRTGLLFIYPLNYFQASTWPNRVWLLFGIAFNLWPKSTTRGDMIIMILPKLRTRQICDFKYLELIESWHRAKSNTEGSKT